MLKFTKAINKTPMLILSKRSATTITSLNDKKLTNLLARLDKFDSKSKIFDKLDELYLLSQRKGFFNLDANNLEFLSNNQKISDNINNLYNFNNLNKLVSNQYSNLLMLPSPSAKNQQANGITPPPFETGAAQSAGRMTNVPNFKVSITSNSNNPNHANVANSIPGLNAFMATTLGNYGRNSPVDKYLNLLQGLARNDVELKNKIEQVLEAFNNEDDYFFNYVLEFWISGKSFNKKKAKKLQDEKGNGQLPSNLTMS